MEYDSAIINGLSLSETTEKKLKYTVLMWDSTQIVWFHFYAILEKAKLLMMEGRSAVARG